MKLATPATDHAPVPALTDRTLRARERFLRALAETANITAACAMAGISRDTAYRWRAHDHGFAAAWTEALDAATDALEAEARRRAMEGVPEPVVSGGRVVLDETGAPLMVRRYSDRLMEVLLRAHRPEKYSPVVRVEAETDLAALSNPQLQEYFRAALLAEPNGEMVEVDGVAVEDTATDDG